MSSPQDGRPDGRPLASSAQCCRQPHERVLDTRTSPSWRSSRRCTHPTVTPEGGAASARPPQVSVEAALEHGDLLTAFRTTEAAHRRAIRDRRWESLIDVRDAYYRIAGQTGAPHVARQRAHDAYEAALHGARRAESLDGVLRAAESFAQLGDVEEVVLSLHVARDLAGSDREAVDDVQAAAGRLGDLLEAARTDARGD
jgi:hypothetical protein